MRIFGRIKKTNDTINMVECESNEIIPVTYETMENVIKLIEIANETNSDFSLLLNLSIDSFKIDSDNFKDIKLLKGNKTQPDRVMISSSDVLLTTETTIELQHIAKVTVFIQYEKKESDNK